LPGTPLPIRSPLDVGMSAGKWCSYAKPGDQPPDQRLDDGGSLVFETEPLGSALEIAGDPAVDLAFTVDRPVAQVAVRLVDVAPDGAATRVTYGVFNLTHRNGHEHPEALEPGRPYRVRIPMKPVAQHFAPGHRIRLAVSTTYFPLTWPGPEQVTMTLHPADTTLDLPLRTASSDDANLPPFGAPESGPGPEIERIATVPNGWRVVRDHATNTVTAEISDGSGTHRLVARDITVTKQGPRALQRGERRSGEPHRHHRMDRRPVSRRVDDALAHRNDFDLGRPKLPHPGPPESLARRRTGVRAHLGRTDPAQLHLERDDFRLHSPWRPPPGQMSGTERGVRERRLGAAV
jgi:hypothetical protein